MSADDRFDAVTRAAADGLSRRQIVRMLAGGVAGGTLLTAFTGARARGATDPCVDRCGSFGFTGRQRGECLQICNRCRAEGGQLCEGGTGVVCCAGDAQCCVSHVGQMCCPAGSRCCIGRKGHLACCPESTECCGTQCCPPGQCCFSVVAPGATCCPPGETCCFDPDFGPGDNRCGTIDPVSGNCVPV